MVATKSKINKRQVRAYSFLRNNETKWLGYGGSAGGGKSWLGCEWLQQVGYNLPGSRWFIGRNNIKDTRESVLVTWAKVAKVHGFYEYKTGTAGIRFKNGSEIVFLDLTYYPKLDPNFERFGSKEFTGGWIEEASQISFGAFDQLKSRVGRHLNDEYGVLPKILVTMNPSKNWLYKTFYRPWRDGILDSDTAFVQALPTDNPYLTKEYLEVLHSIKDKARKQRLLYGNWEYDDDPSTLIDFDAITDSFTNDYIKPDDNNRYLTIDVATKGSDLFVIAVWYGFVLVDLFTMDKSSGKEIIDKIKEVKNEHRVRESNIVYDADGVGGFIGGRKGFFPGAKSFLNGSRPLKYKGVDENYEHLKAQCSYHMAERINEGGYYFKALKGTRFEEIAVEELEQVKSRDSDKDGKQRIARKEDVKTILGRSPDLKDVIMMREYFELDHRQLPKML